MPPNHAALLEKARQVKLVIFDVDGVLTDGTLTYGPSGEVAKTFSVRDGHGMVLLRLNGVSPAILSARDSEMVWARMRDLGVSHVVQGERDKLKGLQRLLDAVGCDVSEAAFIGDDLNDLPVLRRVGLSAAPADADPRVLEAVDFVSARGGGQGAGRELCDLVLEARGIDGAV